MVSYTPKFLRLGLPPVRRYWSAYVGSAAFLLILLGGAVVLEQHGFWPDALKTARQRQLDAQRVDRTQGQSSEVSQGAETP